MRLCPAVCEAPSGDVMTDDLGRMLGAVGPGDGDGEPRSNGSLCHRALLEAVVDIFLAMQPRSNAKTNNQGSGKYIA